MKLQRLFTPAALALALTMASVPALAQSGGKVKQRGSRDGAARTTESGNQNPGSRGDAAVLRSTVQADWERGNQAQAQSRPNDNGGYSARPNDNRGATARGNDNRGDAAVRRSTPQAESGRANRPQAQSRPNDNGGYSARPNDNRGAVAPGNDNRAYNARPNDNRGYDTRGYSNGAYNARPNDNRGYDTRGYSNGAYNNRGYDARGYNTWQYSNRGPGWRGSYDRNAWHGRVRFGLGISIFSGRPFGFRFDYGWRPGFDYRYQMRQGVAYGGMTFLLDPDYAEVYIDGNFVGIARDFGGQPVPVAVGYHRIELYAQGFEPVAFDINVFPGQVIPYRGSLGQVY